MILEDRPEDDEEEAIDKYLTPGGDEGGNRGGHSTNDAGNNYLGGTSSIETLAPDDQSIAQQSHPSIRRPIKNANLGRACSLTTICEQPEPYQSDEILGLWVDLFDGVIATRDGKLNKSKEKIRSIPRVNPRRTVPIPT